MTRTFAEKDIKFTDPGGYTEEVYEGNFILHKILLILRLSRFFYCYNLCLFCGDFDENLFGSMFLILLYRIKFI